MTFTYSFNPNASLKDRVRFLLGDTKSGAPLLQDEEIAAVLQDSGNDPNLAAIACCEAIVSRMAQMRDQSVGDVSVSASQLTKSYTDMLSRLRAKFGQTGAYLPYAGGISRSDKHQNEHDADRVRPFAKREQGRMHSEGALGPGAYDDGFDGWP